MSTPESAAAPPKPPFSDYRYEAPGNVRKITLSDLPEPYATSSAANQARLVPRPPGLLPQAPAGFHVNLFAEDLNGPRVIRGRAERRICSWPRARRVRFASTAESPPTAGRNPRRYSSRTSTGPMASPLPARAASAVLYIGDTDAVVRVPYQVGDLEAKGPAEHVVDLPGGRGHWTRDIAFSLDSQTMFVAVGSGSNVDDPDTSPAERHRADILAFDPDGSHQRIYASGIRNPSGIAVEPGTGKLWTTVNERDGLGDNLVPDYITSVREGGFYGWPWWYMGSHQDPRHAGKHPELKDQVITPDVILQPHNASAADYLLSGSALSDEYRGDLFATEHGFLEQGDPHWIRVIRIPRHHAAEASGEYEDFLTGFVLPDGKYGAVRSGWPLRPTGRCW